MARLLIIYDKKPKEIRVGGESEWICMCGLSKSRPFCDGSHKKCESERPGEIVLCLDNSNKKQIDDGIIPNTKPELGR